MFYVVVGLLAVAALIAYGDAIQRREKREQAAQQQQLVAQQQQLVSALAVPAIVEQVKAQLEEEMGERMGDAIADVQDAILASLSEVIHEAVHQPRGNAAVGCTGGGHRQVAGCSANDAPSFGDSVGASDAAPVKPSARLAWDGERGLWTDGVSFYGRVAVSADGVRAA